MNELLSDPAFWISTVALIFSGWSAYSSHQSSRTAKKALALENEKVRESRAQLLREQADRERVDNEERLRETAAFQAKLRALNIIPDMRTPYSQMNWNDLIQIKTLVEESSHLIEAVDLEAIRRSFEQIQIVSDNGHKNPWKRHELDEANRLTREFLNLIRNQLD